MNANKKIPSKMFYVGRIINIYSENLLNEKEEHEIIVFCVEIFKKKKKK